MSVNRRLARLLLISAAGCISVFARAADEPGETPAPTLAPGVVDHGAAAPVGLPTWGNSIIATQDGDGKKVVFIKLWTGSSSSYLFIDAETGKTEQVRHGERGWGAYLVFRAPDQMIYDTIGNYMVAINPADRSIRRLGEIPGGMALSFARAEDGTIYAGIYPTATLVSWNPATETYTNHGQLNDEEWPQYMRPMEIDDTGWVYAGIAIAEMQIVGFNPATGEKKTFIPEGQRQRGNPTTFLGSDGLFNGTNGKVYAFAEGWGWHEMHGGEATPVDEPTAKPVNPGKEIFPDGSRYVDTDVPGRTIAIVDKGAARPRTIHFDYESPGVNIYTVIAGPDGKVHGATGIPLRIWELDPATGKMIHRGLGGNGGHVNQFARRGDTLYGGIYSSGDLIQYDPRQPYEDVPVGRGNNPRLLHASEESRDQFGRPKVVFAHPDGRHIVLGGNAARVIPGSGLLIYDLATSEATLLEREKLVEGHGINAIAALPGGDLLIGTSIRPATGGAPTTGAAVLFRFSMTDHTVKAQWPLTPAVEAVQDLLAGPDGMIYGFASDNRFFIFDPASEKIVHEEVLSGYGEVSGYMAPRMMAFVPEGQIYALFRDAIVEVDPKTRTHREVVRPGVPITTGIAITGGRIYFASGPRLYSYGLGAGG